MEQRTHSFLLFLFLYRKTKRMNATPCTLTDKAAAASAGSAGAAAGSAGSGGSRAARAALAERAAQAAAAFVTQ